MKQNKKPFLLGLLAGAILMLAVFEGVSMYNRLGSQSQGPTSREAKSKLSTIVGLINHHYLQDTDGEALTDAMLKGLISGLDDTYAAYYTKEEYEEILESTNGEYTGIGLVMTQDAETKEVTIAGCYEDSPAEAAGIETGDILISVDDMKASETDLTVLAQTIKTGDSDTVHVVWEHDGQQKEADLKRGVISVPVVSGRMEEDSIGYIRILQFTSSTAQQFHDAYDELNAQGMKSLVVDLRDNPGGLMDAVVDTLNVFMPEGILVYTEDKEGNRVDYVSQGETPIEIPLVVLVNENSASAAEIFAGAVQDYGVGTLVGTKTFGKGIVQKTYTLNDGSAVKMTVAYYYTPNGVCIHGTGITPDETVELPEDTEEDLQLNRALEIAGEKQ